MAPVVVMVAEKPSIAGMLASFLSSGRMSTRKSSLDVHEFDGLFRGFQAHYKVTSVIGHVYGIDFPPKYQNWEVTDPLDLFGAPTLKNEANPKAHVCKHLRQEARGADFLVLWLDCDREGENICFEVMENALPVMKKRSGQQVFRARFSAVSEKDVKAAMDSLVEPNENEALAVDARQEIDLKVGVAFTRFQTRFFQGKYGNLDSNVISFGPCQTPTLGFCVERHTEIITFVPKPFWTLHPRVKKDGHSLQLDWDRGRVFEQATASAFQKTVLKSGSLKVLDVSEKDERKARPTGLNTVNMLKVASTSLGMSPHHAMQVAERLYVQGYISYPRTESTAYPASFDVKESLVPLGNHPVFGDYARTLVAAGVQAPKSGTDAGDHPPITPMRAGTEAELGGDAWRLYDYVVRHFLGSVSPDCKYKRTKITFAGGGETFTCSGKVVKSAGFTLAMPWMAVTDENLPSFSVGETLPCSEVELYQGKTSPPDYLTESDLISLMEKHGIGTDASIPVHINNICQRNYVQVQAGRRLVPTALGITLIRGYETIDPDLCLPDIRSYIERQITLIAKGQVDHETVVRSSLDKFVAKFKNFVSEIEKMDALFEAHFSPLADSGRPLSKCEKCKRYMKYITLRPSRLYCSICEEVYPVPQNGTIKLYKELTCPLDNFELVLFSLGGPDGKSYPLCPYCYNHPLEARDPSSSAAEAATSSDQSAATDDEAEPSDSARNRNRGVERRGKVAIGTGMPCTSCPHATCRHSMMQQGVCACPECDGTLILDPVSAPRWRLDCNKCSFLVYLPPNAHRVSRSDDCYCDDCGSALLEVDFHKNNTPLQGGQTLG